MSGPTTRPIRDDRPRDYATSDEQRSQGERYDHEYSKAREPSHDRAQQSKVRAALMAIIPERFRPVAGLLWGCWLCLCILILSGIGSVEWHLLPPGIPSWTAHTASAEELQKLSARVSVQEIDSAMSLRIQQRARIMTLQEIICLRYDRNLRLELDELMDDYRRRNGVTYSPPVPPACKAS